MYSSISITYSYFFFLSFFFFWLFSPSPARVKKKTALFPANVNKINEAFTIKRAFLHNYLFLCEKSAFIIFVLVACLLYFQHVDLSMKSIV